MNVVGISGSVRSNSYTAAAVKAALEGAQREHAQVSLLDLKDYPLPLVDRVRKDEESPEVVRQFRARIREADALIIGTPEYHGGMSGSLKNALDWLGLADLDGKIVGVVGVSGGALGAHEAMNQVRTTLRALHAWTVPEQAGIASVWKTITPAGQIKDEALLERLLRLGAQVARNARLHSPSGVARAS